MRRTNPKSIRGGGPQSDQRSICCGSRCDRRGARFPCTPGCSSQGIAALGCRPPESRSFDLDHGAGNINARTRVLSGQRREVQYGAMRLICMVFETDTRSGRTYSTIQQIQQMARACRSPSRNAVLVRVLHNVRRHVREQKWRRSIVTLVDQSMIAGHHPWARSRRRQTNYGAWTG